MRNHQPQFRRESYINSNFHGANGYEVGKMIIESLQMQEIQKLRSTQSAYTVPFRRTRRGVS